MHQNKTISNLSDGSDVVDGQVGRSEAESKVGVVEGISLALDQNGAADGDGRLGADDGDHVLASLLVADFLKGPDSVI